MLDRGPGIAPGFRYAAGRERRANVSSEAHLCVPNARRLQPGYHKWARALFQQGHSVTALAEREGDKKARSAASDHYNVFAAHEATPLLAFLPGSEPLTVSGLRLMAKSMVTAGFYLVHRPCLPR